MDSQTSPGPIQLGFIGGGKLAGSVIRGLVRARYCPAGAILVSEPNEAARRILALAEMMMRLGVSGVTVKESLAESPGTPVSGSQTQGPPSLGFPNY